MYPIYRTLKGLKVKSQHAFIIMHLIKRKKQSTATFVEEKSRLVDLFCR
jgi:hypothetical protein